MSEVPFFRPSIGDEEVAAVERVLRSGWLTTGAETRAFEAEFAAWIGAKHAVAVNSCTAALHLALEAHRVTRGDTVLCPTLTFAATAEVVRYFDATPVFVDCEPDDLCVDPDAVERTLDDIARGRAVPGLGVAAAPPRALLPVHYGGQVCQMDRLSAAARGHGVAVIEDAAHTLPAYFRTGPDQPWRPAGTMSAIGCFSFYANKPLTTGEGGMAVTDDEELARRMRLMSLHGLSADAWQRFTAAGSWHFEVVDAGYKYNLTDIAAALGRVQLRRAEALWERRRRLAALYREALMDVDELILPDERPDRRHSWHLFVVRLRLERLAIDRDGFIAELRRRGVVAAVHWRPLHMQRYYRERYGLRPEDFPVAADAWPRIVSLPFYPDMTDEQVATVARHTREVLAAHRKKG